MHVHFFQLSTVKCLNNGYIGGRDLVVCWEVVPILEVDLSATPINPKVESVDGCGLQYVESATFTTDLRWSNIE